MKNVFKKIVIRVIIFIVMIAIVLFKQYTSTSILNVETLKHQLFKLRILLTLLNLKVKLKA